MANFDDTADNNLSRRLSIAALVCCAVSFIVASTGILGYLPGMRLLGSIFSGYIPMAPSTALSFIFLSVILNIYRSRPATGILHAGCVLTAGFVSLFGLLKFGEHFTGRKQVETALEESEEEQKNLIAKMMNAFALHEIVYNAEGEASDYKCLQVNPAWEKIVGAESEMVVGKTIREVMPGIEDVLVGSGGGE